MQIASLLERLGPDVMADRIAEWTPVQIAIACIGTPLSWLRDMMVRVQVADAARLDAHMTALAGCSVVWISAMIKSAGM